MTTNHFGVLKLIHTNPNNHVIFKNIRNFNESIYDEFWQMLRGDLN